MYKITKLFYVATLVLTLLLIYNSQLFAMEAKVVELPGINAGGQVVVKPTQDAAFVNAKVNDIIKENGIIATGKTSNSLAEILVEEKASKSLIRLANNTLLKLTPSSSQLKLLLANGKILIQNQNSHNLSIGVGNYIATTEGTTLLMEVEENPDDPDEVNTNIEVLEGSVKFQNIDDPKEQPVVVFPGEKRLFKLRFNKLNQMEKRRRLKDLDFSNPEIANELPELFSQRAVARYTLREQKKLNVKLSMYGPLYNFKRPLFEENKRRIQQNILYQNQGKLEHFNRNLIRSPNKTNFNLNQPQSNNPKEQNNRRQPFYTQNQQVNSKQTKPPIYKNKQGSLKGTSPPSEYRKPKKHVFPKKQPDNIVPPAGQMNQLPGNASTVPDNPVLPPKNINKKPISPKPMPIKGSPPK